MIQVWVILYDLLIDAELSWESKQEHNIIC